MLGAEPHRVSSGLDDVQVLGYRENDRDERDHTCRTGGRASGCGGRPKAYWAHKNSTLGLKYQSLSPLVLRGKSLISLIYIYTHSQGRPDHLKEMVLPFLSNWSKLRLDRSEQESGSGEVIGERLSRPAHLVGRVLEVTWCGLIGILVPSALCVSGYITTSSSSFTAIDRFWCYSKMAEVLEHLTFK